MLMKLYLLWNLPFFKMVPPKTNFSPFLKPWADNSLTNQYSYQLFYGWGWHTSCHPISKMHIVGEGPGETPSALRCLSYLINKLANRHKTPCQKLARGHSFCPFLMSMSAAFSLSLSLSLSYILIKFCYPKGSSGEASSLALDRIPLLQRPRIPA